MNGFSFSVSIFWLLASICHASFLQQRDLWLGATITYPSGPVPAGGWPGIVLVPGSGPSNRWETDLFSLFSTTLMPPVMTYHGGYCYFRSENIQPLREIAEYLAETTGYAVMAFDTRGCLKSRGVGCNVTLCSPFSKSGNCLNNSLITFEDQINDAINAAYTLIEWGANPNKMSIVGHSMGCTIAPLAAQTIGAKKVGLLMGSGINIGTTLVRQISQQIMWYSAAVNSTLCNLTDPTQKQLYQNLVNSVDVLSSDINPLIAAVNEINQGMNVTPFTPVKLPGIGVEPYIYWKQWFTLTTGGYIQAALDSFLSNQTNHLFVLNSPTDLQVSPSEYLPLHAMVRENPNAQIHLINELTHVLTAASLETGRVQPSVLSAIADFFR